ncbi:MAG: protein kinase, partial [Candidatus Aminicenantes bacterium]|nr:protein kinase [Candidatus Aminicenantes bacterium]
MPLPDLPGRTLLHYRITEKIGEGGMGAVYKAVDTHLDRPVAIKVLPPDRVADLERRQRFVQEAKAASALRHPNIVVIHDIAAGGGRDFIVMELVEGHSLDTLIGRKGLKLGQALGIAVQIADGLAKAHAAGIVHRDIKPTNIMVTPDGLVKILDFGLAKLSEAGPDEGAGPTMTMAPDQKPRTEEGYVVGTAAYMSPEQAEGKNVDARSDIFSFGAVLYEMLTGRKAFGRESGIKSLAAVLNEDPPPASAVNEAVPAEIERVLNRCLRKDPQRRWQTMSDLKVALQDLKEDSESGKLAAPVVTTGRKKKRSAFFTAALSVLALAAAAIALKLLILKPKGPVEYEIAPLTFDSGMTAFPTVSPDGKQIAFVSNRDGSTNLAVMNLDGTGYREITLYANGEQVYNPSWSPSGDRIVFDYSVRDGRDIAWVRPDGADLEFLVTGDDDSRAARFSNDGRAL